MLPWPREPDAWPAAVLRKGDKCTSCDLVGANSNAQPQTVFFHGILQSCDLVSDRSNAVSGAATGWEPVSRRRAVGHVRYVEALTFVTLSRGNKYLRFLQAGYS